MTREARISIYNIILNYVLNRGLQDYDDFSQKFTDAIIKDFSSGEYDLKRTIRKIKTSFFKLNSLKRSDFLSKDLERRIHDAWRRTTRYIEPPPKASPLAVKGIKPDIRCKRIYVDDIDSFKEVRKIDPSQVKDLVPLDLKEQYIKESLAEIIGEAFIQKDWGGEWSDLFTTRIILGRKRVSAAFLLKGRGLRKSKLTIADCGKNGDQIVRLVKQPAALFIVQYVGEIDPMVLEFLEAMVEKESRKSNRILYYCLMDGIDTARVLLAYRKIKR